MPENGLATAYHCSINQRNIAPVTLVVYATVWGDNSSAKVCNGPNPRLSRTRVATNILYRLMHRYAMLVFEGKCYQLKKAAARIATTGDSSQSERPSMGVFVWP
jgi:hypothetical protein